MVDFNTKLDYYFQEPDDFIFFDVQKKGVEFLIEAKHAILADHMGVGKSLQILKTNAHYKPKKVLICGSKNSTFTWMKEIKKWYPNLAIRTRLVRGTLKQRHKLWEDTNEINITVITYGVLKADLELILQEDWDAIYFDEAHKWRNRKTDTYKAVKKLCRTAKPELLIPCTGTPASKGPQDMFTLFQIVRPKQYTSYWRYVDTYCIFDDNGFGKEFVGVQKMIQFKEENKPHYIRRPKDDSIPKKTRSIIPIYMSKEETKLYNEFAHDMILELEGEDQKIVASTTLALRTRLRQLLVCPKLLDSDLGIGSSMEYVTEHLQENEISKAVIFTSYPSAFPFFEEYLLDKKYDILKMRGGMEVEEIEYVTTTFNDTDANTIVLLSIKFAESFDLVAAKQGYVIGPDDDPQVNYQAEDRIHRRGLEHEINIMYNPHLRTVELEQFDILNEKVRNTNAIYNSPKLLKKVLKDHKI